MSEMTLKTQKNDIYNKASTPVFMGALSGFTMKYSTHYINLIQTRKERVSCDEYTETHHIQPICCGGNDEPENLVKLTFREHFVAHWLLHRMFPENEDLAYAFDLMARCVGSKRTTYTPSSRAVAEAKAAVRPHLWKAAAKAVQQFDLEGTFIAEFPSVVQAATDLKLDASSIGHVCNGTRGHSLGGFQWKFANDPKKMGRYGARPGNSTTPVEQYTKDGEYVGTWGSIKEAQNTLGIHQISAVIKGKRATAGGFKWFREGAANKAFCGTQISNVLQTMNETIKSNLTPVSATHEPNIAHYVV